MVSTTDLVLTFFERKGFLRHLRVSNRTVILRFSRFDRNCHVRFYNAQEAVVIVVK